MAILSTRSVRFSASSMPHSPMLPVPIHAQQAVVAVSITRTSITNYIKSHGHLHSSAFLDELQSDLSRHGVKVPMSTLFQTLRRFGITRKKVSHHALERNEACQQFAYQQIAEPLLCSRSSMIFSVIASFWLRGKPSTGSDVAKAKTLTASLLGVYI